MFDAKNHPMQSLKERLSHQAIAEGFSDIGITAPNTITPFAQKHLQRFLAQGYHAQMNWLAERVSWRSNPTALWPKARSIIMLAENYGPEKNPLPLLQKKECGVISVYAQGKDYHDLVKKRLKKLGRWLIDQKPCEIKVFVDTAPVMEKPLAQAAGLGWQGKHTNVLSRRLGSWFFLGAIFTTLDLPKDVAESDHCGSCRFCLDICPTQAFPAPYQLDARRCISYLTIEHKGPVDLWLRPLLGNRIYGCDDCLAVCPWNKFAQRTQELGYIPRHGTPKLAELALLDDTGFRAHFSGSPIKRIGRGRFVRNVLYAIGNSEQLTLADVAQKQINDPDETIADAARWAVSRLRGERYQGKVLDYDL